MGSFLSVISHPCVSRNFPWKGAQALAQLPREVSKAEPLLGTGRRETEGISSFFSGELVLPSDTLVGVYRDSSAGEVNVSVCKSETEKHLSATLMDTAS